MGVAVGSGLVPGWGLVGSFGGSCFPLRVFPLRVFQGEFVLTFVCFVDNLVKVFCGESLLGGGCCVCTCVSEVVCGPVCGVDHVGLFV